MKPPTPKIIVNQTKATKIHKKAIATRPINAYQMNSNLKYQSFLQTLNLHVNHRGSYMSAHVSLNLLNELGKRDKMRGLPRILSLFFATSLINSIIQEHE